MVGERRVEGRRGVARVSVEEHLVGPDQRLVQVFGEPFTKAALSFIVYGNPEPRGSKTAGIGKGGRRFMRDSNPKSYPWMSDVAQAAGLAMHDRKIVGNREAYVAAGGLFRGPLRVDVDFYLPRPKGHFGSGKNEGKVKASAPSRPITKPDKGKLERGTLDALEGVVYANDAQVVEGDSRKFYGEPARCEIRIFDLSTDSRTAC